MIHFEVSCDATGDDDDDDDDDDDEDDDDDTMTIQFLYNVYTIMIQ